ATNRSYGGVHRLLADAGVTFRSRGGEMRKKTSA
ncbi:helix-turn-helix domain-containing protein, partial [Streptomyces sp. NPDC005151]